MRSRRAEAWPGRGPRRSPFPQNGQRATSPGRVPQTSAGCAEGRDASAFLPWVSEIRQLQRRIASGSGTSRAEPPAAARTLWHTASTRCAMARRTSTPSPKNPRVAPSKWVRTLSRRGPLAVSARCWMVDTPRRSARLENLKKRVLSRGSTSPAHSPLARSQRPQRNVRSCFGPPRTRTGTSMQVGQPLAGSSRHRELSVHAQGLHPTSNSCSYANLQRSAETLVGAPAFPSYVRHGPCLDLVYPRVALPVGGGVNEEMAA